MKTLDLPSTFTIEELLEAPGWRMGRSATYAAVKSGAIPSVRIGRRILIPRAALERLLSGEGTAA